jgi:hypothetical protein
MQAFTQLDVCFAYRGWHAKSFANAFSAKK